MVIPRNRAWREIHPVPQNGSIILSGGFLSWYANDINKLASFGSKVTGLKKGIEVIAFFKYGLSWASSSPMTDRGWESMESKCCGLSGAPAIITLIVVSGFTKSTEWPSPKK